MTVGELIEMLEKYPRDTAVVSFTPRGYSKEWVDHGGPVEVSVYKVQIPTSRDGFYSEWRSASLETEIEAIEL